MYREQPESIESLIQCVKDFAASYGSPIIRRDAAKVLKNAKLCLNADGGHFQHLLKYGSERLLCLSLLMFVVNKNKITTFQLLNKT